jgi:hypothetical protein
MISRRGPRKCKNLGLQAKTPLAVIYGYASKRPKLGCDWAKYAPFHAPFAMARSAQSVVLSEDLAIRRRFTCAKRAAI